MRPDRRWVLGSVVLFAATAVGAGIDFASSRLCSQCHANAVGARAMRDSRGVGIAPFDLWSPTMMANATKDPFWRAVVSVELAATPSRRAEIEAKCMRCHAPMSRAEPAIAQLDREGTEGRLARDGVSCTVCHQITAERLGAAESFSGGFVLGRSGEIFGPHRDLHAMPMLHHSGFRPTYAPHVGESSLCATCHTLLTGAFDAAGAPVGATLPEQTPYLEWRNSVFNDETAGSPEGASCQDCHMPTIDEAGIPIHTAIARNPGGRDFGFARPRSPFGRHALIGGNATVPAMLELDSTVGRAREQLEQRTATVEIGEVKRERERLSIPITVRNRTGHKFPTGHPSRRAWLRVVVRSADGETIFASGRFDARGRLVNGRGHPLDCERPGGTPQPHRRRVERETETAIFEAVMADRDGSPTYLLMRGTSFLKDDRLLPEGWSDEHPDAGLIAPAGVGGDGDFAAGSDTVVYRVRAPGKRGPYRIEAELFYQPLGSRYVAEILRYDTPEVRSFRERYERIEPRAVCVAGATRDTR